MLSNDGGDQIALSSTPPSAITLKEIDVLMLVNFKACQLLLDYFTLKLSNYNLQLYIVQKLYLHNQMGKHFIITISMF